MLITDRDIDRFLIHSQKEIIATVSEIMKAREMVMAHLNRGPDFLMTAVLAIDREGVILDAVKDGASSPRLLQSRSLRLITSLNRVKIQFDTGSAVAVRLGGHPAYRVPTPTSLLKFQRREHYRVETPVSNPLTCRLITRSGNVLTTLVDIGVGGVCLTGYPGHVVLTTGEEYRNCIIDLGNAGRLEADIKVRNAVDSPMRNGKKTRRVNCSFSRLPPGGEATLQRFVTRLDLFRRGRGDGF